MTGRGLIGWTIGAMAWLLILVSSALAAPTGLITETPVGVRTRSYLFGLTTGPDGAIWFADLSCTGLGRCAIGRVGHQGRVAEYRRGLAAGSVPYAIAAGADGNLWFTDEGRRPAIGRITPRGRITEFRRGLRRGSVPFGITERTGPHPPRLWFTDHGCNGSGHCAVGSVTPRGRIAELTRGLRAGSQPLGITAGPGGDVWFADSSGALGKVTPAGLISERTRGLGAGSSPVAIAAGPRGELWFTDEGVTPAVGRMARSGAVREFSRGLLPGSQPAYITRGPDGRMWFTDEGATTALGAVTTGVRCSGTCPPVQVDGGALAPALGSRSWQPTG